MRSLAPFKTTNSANRHQFTGYAPLQCQSPLKGELAHTGALAQRDGATVHSGRFSELAYRRKSDCEPLLNFTHFVSDLSKCPR